MKKKIHPKYDFSTAMCACGNVVHTRSTKKTINVEICSNCHPFFTGKQKFVDSEGRVDKFIKKYGAMSCATIQQKLFGRIYWITDPDEWAKFDTAGAHSALDKCMDVVGDAARWTLEILFDKGVVEL